MSKKTWSINFKPISIPTSAGPSCMSTALRRRDDPQRPLFVFLHGLVQPVTSFLPALGAFLDALGEEDDDQPDWLLYNRFGAGESDEEPREGGHTLPLAVEDLRQLLRRCVGSSGSTADDDEAVDSVPMGFVVHSIGGALVRYYAQQYSCANIKAILFLDPMIASTDFVSIYQPRAGEQLSQQELGELEKAREISGHIFHPSLPNAEGFDRSKIASLLPVDDEPKIASATRRPWITVVAHDPDVNARDSERKLGIPQRATRRFLEPRWEQYNRSLLALTTPDRARGPIVAEGADHFIQVARPDVVAAEMRFLWDKVRGLARA